MTKRSESIESRIVSGLIHIIWVFCSWPWSVKKINQPSQITLTKVNSAEIGQRWQTVIEQANLGGPSHFRLALIEADNIFDTVLKQAGLPGQTFAERLQQARTIFKSNDIYQQIWQAHKLRNRLVHETGEEVMSWEVRDALKSFEAALSHLGIMQGQR